MKTRMARAAFISRILKGVYFLTAKGKATTEAGGYRIGEKCNGCGLCLAACPQRCIRIDEILARIAEHHCLHCGRCVEVCTQKAIVCI